MSFGGDVPQRVQFVLGGMAGMTASAVTHPLDTLKVQLQLQGQNPANAATRKPQLGAAGMASYVVNAQGVRKGLYPGLSASLLRQATYTTTRMGLYMYLRGDTKKGENVKLWRQALASLVAGALGALVGNPADVCLVRMQADVRLLPEDRRNYGHVFNGLRRVYAEEGLAALYTGATPNMQRAALITLGQLASYDRIKSTLLRFIDEGLGLQLVASTIAGGITAAITNPVDVVKTRVMQDKTGLYSSATTAVRLIVKNEGLKGFYKGFVPYFSRMGPQTVVTLIAYEQYAKLYLQLWK